jgi:hypothetical protein
MTAYAIIVGGIVANIAEADAAFAQENGWIPAQGGAIGDLWDGESFTKPARDLAADRAAQWEAIKAKRDTLSDNGGYLVDGKWFHSDGKSKTQQLSLFIMGASVPAVQWKTMDGSFVTMTQALAAQVFAAAAAQDMAIFAAAEQHKALMEASADPAAYDFSAGWPATYTATL